MTRVLVVDDEPMVRDVLERYLVKEGFDVEAAADGAEALAVFERTAPDLVLLDLMLPKIDGFSVFDRIRARSQTPVIMLTARGAPTERAVGLERGADDYVTKPFSPREVLARVRSVLRRSDSQGSPAGDRLTFGAVQIDLRAREVTLHEAEVTLTPKEFDILAFLAAHPNTVFDRVDLLSELWDFAYDGDPSTVTVHIRRLRQKIEADPSDPKHLQTVWGVGYRLVP